MIFYTIDRNKSLKEGQILDLKKYNDIMPKELQEHVDILFPNGVSSHGNSYFLSSYSNPSSVNGLLELVFEYVRRSHFQDKPSRFQSLFAFEKLENIDEFIKKIGWKGDYKIWKVECDNFFQADMNLLRLAPSNLGMSKMAHLYWEGKSISDIDINSISLWEYLLISPIKVICEVEIK